LTAVVLPPLSVESGGESKLWQALARPFRGYIEMADLDHGYRFFGPEPGASHLVRYQLEMPDGSKREDVFPNLAEERPRLLYHRYFMLAEHLNMLYGPVDQIDEAHQMAEKNLPPMAPERVAVERGYQAANASLHAMVRSYADELLHRTGAKSVHLELIEHAFPPPDAVLAGMKLNDPSLYRQEADLGTFTEHSP
jgi:hypothetical protein